MKRFWHLFIEPVLISVSAKNIVEIGADTGINTKNILDYCEKVDGRLVVVDSKPSFDQKEFEESYGTRFKLMEDISLKVLPAITGYDAILIDGDHNWYTVYNELKLVEFYAKQHKVQPLIFFHDIGWPYARRDLYYDPSTIPEEYQKPYDRKGMVPGQSALAETGGLNSGLCNAIEEHGKRNGVLTAIEDFLAESEFEYRFVKIHGARDLGIMVEKSVIANNPILDALLDSFEVSRVMAKHIQNLEILCTNRYLEIEECRRLLAMLKESR